MPISSLASGTGHVPRRRPGLPILVAVTAIGPLALNIFMPSMPSLQRVFSTDYATVQLSLTLFLIGIAGAQLAYGPLSDRYGRRPILLTGLSLFMAGTLLCWIATGIEMLIAGRVVQAIGACSGMVLSRAIIRDIYDRDRATSMIAYVMMAMVVAPMVAPLIGGILDTAYGWRANFAFLALLGLIILPATWFLLHETHHARETTSSMAGMFGSFGTLLSLRRFQGYAGFTAFGTGAFFIFLGGAPYVMVELLERSSQEYGFYFIPVAACYMIGNGLAGRYSGRIGGDRVIWLGGCVAILGALALLVQPLTGTLTAPGLFGAMGIISLSNGLSLPNGMAGAVSVRTDMAGAASGLTGCAQMGLGALGTVLVGSMLGDTATPLAALMLLSSVIALACHVWGQRLAVET